MNIIELKAPYGRISMNILKRNDITPKQKLVYAIISAKQGETDVAKLTQKMIAEAVGISERYVSNTIKELTEINLIARDKKGHYKTKSRANQYGMIELDILITTNLSYRAKYLYLIYCAVGNKDYDANNWSSKKVSSEFRIGMTTYQQAHKELIDKGILKVYGMASGNGIQTSNMNRILRVDRFTIIHPTSWVPPEAFDVDVWCNSNLNDEQGVEAKPELSVEPNRNSQYNLTGTESRTNSNLNNNLNSNHNSKRVTNEGLHPALHISLKSENEYDQDNGEEGKSIVDFKPDLFSELEFKRFRTNEEALKVIDDMNTKAGMKDYLNEYVEDETLLDKAFIAYDALIETLDSYDIDTSGYALNCADLMLFQGFYDRVAKISEEDLKYHVQRVAQLGIEKEKKDYISFSYVFSPIADLKLEPGFKKSMQKKGTVSVTPISDTFLYANIINTN